MNSILFKASNNQYWTTHFPSKNPNATEWIEVKFDKS